MASTIWYQRRKYRLQFFMAAILFSLFFGQLLFPLELEPSPIASLARPFKTAEMHTLQGVITNFPDHRFNKSKFIITTKIGKLLATSSYRRDSLHFGDKVKVRGKLIKPGQIERFDYYHFLAKDSIYATMPRAQITVISHQKTWLTPIY